MVQKIKMEGEILRVLLQGGPWAALLAFVMWKFVIPGYKNIMAKNNRLIEEHIKAAADLREEMAKMREENILLRKEMDSLKAVEIQLKKELEQKNITIKRLTDRVAQLENK